MDEEGRGGRGEHLFLQPFLRVPYASAREPRDKQEWMRRDVVGGGEHLFYDLCRSSPPPEWPRLPAVPSRGHSAGPAHTGE